MVSTKEGYDYVTGANADKTTNPYGDLDRIIINGEIMPLRTGFTGKVGKDGKPIPRANILRGEDIAFLMEFANQRRFAITGGTWISGGKSYSFGGLPQSLDSYSKSEFDRRLYNGGRNKDVYDAFSALASVTTSTSKTVRLFDEISLGAEFSYQAEWHTVLPKGYYRYYIDDNLQEKYGGGTFDVTGLTRRTSGNALEKQPILDFFSKAETITNKGVGIVLSGVSFADADSEADDVLKYDRSVEEWADSTEKYAEHIPQWGVCDESFFGSAYRGCGFPPRKCNVLSVDAPHGARVIAICVFVVMSFRNNYDFQNPGYYPYRYDCVVLMRPYAMTEESAQTFVLKSDNFASAASVKDIVNASGVSFPADSYSDSEELKWHYNTASISLTQVVPIVYFDDHTRW